MKLDGFPPDVARLIEQAKETPVPAAPAAARARVLARLDGAAAAANAATGTTAASAPAAAAGSTLSLAGLPLALGTFLVGIGVGVVGQRAITAPAPQLIPLVEPAAPAEPLPAPVAFVTVPGDEPRVARAPAPAPATASTLARERAILELARMAQPAQALVHLAQHRRAFPAGALAEERDALTVRALAGAGRRAEAATAARAFLARYPRSMFRGLVEPLR